MRTRRRNPEAGDQDAARRASPTGGCSCQAMTATPARRVPSTTPAKRTAPDASLPSNCERAAPTPAIDGGVDPGRAAARLAYAQSAAACRVIERATRPSPEGQRARLRRSAARAMTPKATARTTRERCPRGDAVARRGRRRSRGPPRARGPRRPSAGGSFSRRPCVDTSPRVQARNDAVHSVRDRTLQLQPSAVLQDVHGEHLGELGRRLMKPLPHFSSKSAVTSARRDLLELLAVGDQLLHAPGDRGQHVAVGLELGLVRQRPVARDDLRLCRWRWRAPCRTRRSRRRRCRRSRCR